MCAVSVSILIWKAMMSTREPGESYVEVRTAAGMSVGQGCEPCPQNNLPQLSQRGQPSPWFPQSPSVVHPGKCWSCSLCARIGM